MGQLSTIPTLIIGQRFKDMAHQTIPPAYSGTKNTRISSPHSNLLANGQEILTSGHTAVTTTPVQTGPIKINVNVRVRKKPKTKNEDSDTEYTASDDE
jgi:hypothetical protein